MRLQRIGLIGMTVFGALYGLLQASAYNSVAGTTVAEREAFGRQMETLGRTLSYLLPNPGRLDTVGGYLDWRVFGALPLLFGFWALMSASGATRGDEDRGLIEQWRSAGIGPVRYVGNRFAGFFLAAAVAVAATSAAIDLGASKVMGSPLDSGAVLETSLTALGLTMCCYAIAMVVAQLTSSRNSAAGLAGAVLAVMFFVNSFGRTVGSLGQVAAFISPFHYYDRTNPLTPGGSFDALGTAGLFVVAIALAAAAAWLMRTRDLGSPLVSRRPRPGPFVDRPSSNPLFRVPVVATLYEHRVGLLAWAAASTLMAGFIASIGRQMVDLVNGSSGFKQYLSLVGHGDPYVAITGYFWFGIFLMLLSVYAISEVSRWTSDDNEGRLETVLSAPVSRSKVVIDRAAALLVASAAIIAASSAGFYASARASNINMPAGDLTTASVLLVPFVLSFAAVGALMAARVPRATVGILATLSFLSYLITLAGPLFKWPDSVLRLSVHTLYGTPLTSGVDWNGLWILLAITVVGFGLAAVLMQRREVGA